LTIYGQALSHSFYTREQRDYTSLTKKTSSFTTYAVVQMDFAQNFSFITQQEIQSAYYSRQQAALFTIYMKIGSEHLNMVIILDYLPHDTRFVYCSQ
jgi:hypothetical protein